MKSFKLFATILVTSILFSATSIAGGWDVFGKTGKYQKGYKRNYEQQSEYKYRGSSGTRYKYDLSNPGDQIRYELDVGAQIRDEIYMPIKPGVEIDRGLNQWGGGVKP